jgi:hypothetical protein
MKLHAVTSLLYPRLGFAQDLVLPKTWFCPTLRCAENACQVPREQGVYAAIAWRCRTVMAIAAAVKQNDHTAPHRNILSTRGRPTGGTFRARLRDGETDRQGYGDILHYCRIVEPSDLNFAP